jgi:amino acid adenylation domain-containing protein
VKRGGGAAVTRIEHENHEIAHIKAKIGSIADDIQVIDIEEDLFVFENNEPFIAPVRKQTSLFYVIYTSGSTGMPKGVLIDERSISDHVFGLIHEADLSSCSSFALFATLAADAGHAIIFSALLMGKTLHVLSDELLHDGDKVRQYLAENNIDCLKIVPSLWLAYVLDAKAPLANKVMIFGGETFSKRIIEILSNSSSKAQVYNHYGPTEVTIGKCVYRVNLEKVFETSIPIGKPFSNTQVYILNDFNQLSPIGIPGELCIGGLGLARGYLNRPDFTAAKFVDDPYRPGEKMYRTGDRARWLRDGNIEFLGRKDDQVKIRGYRIELGEIEHALLKMEGINGAAVAVRANISGEGELVAYVSGPDTIDDKVLRSALSEQLPGYMVPMHYAKLDSIPLTNNGKVNRKLLPTLNTITLKNTPDYLAPNNEKEKALVEVVEDVLKEQNVGLGSDFFLLGGDSIKAIQLVSRLRQRGYRITVQNVLLHPELREMALSVQEGLGNAVGTIEGADVPLGSIQRRFFTQEDVSAHYNQSILLEYPGRLNRKIITEIFSQITGQHELLRAVYKFDRNKNEWVQQIKNTKEFQLEILEEYDDQGEAKFVRFCEALQTSMQFDRGPLLKIGLIHSDQKDYLLLVAHHLIVDGVSWRIIVDDLNCLYSQYLSNQLFELPLRTDSWQFWQNQLHKWTISEKGKKEQSYWNIIEKSVTDQIPKDYSSGSNRVKDAENVEFNLDLDETEILRTKC